MEYQPEVCLSALARLCRELTPRLILLGNDTYSQELSPRLAHRLGGSAAGGSSSGPACDKSMATWTDGANNYASMNFGPSFLRKNFWNAKATWQSA